MNNSNEHRKACLKRHYQNMEVSKAKYLRSIFEKENKRKAIVFAKRVNFAKGYKAI